MRKVRVMPEKSGNILEIFSSYQGEGPYAGVKQVFVRLGGCHLRCVYCDTPESWERRRENQVSLDKVLETVRSQAEAWSPHSVSITGGEPLLQADFLTCLLPEIRSLGLKTYLDTSGTLADRLEKVIDHVDIVALDLKLPSCPGVKIDRKDTRRCVEIARRVEVFVKIVVMEDSLPREVEDATRMIAEVDAGIPVILQTATPVNAETVPPMGEAIARFRAAAERQVTDVTVLPQLHRLAGWK